MIQTSLLLYCFAAVGVGLLIISLFLSEYIAVLAHKRQKDTIDKIRNLGTVLIF